MHPAPAVSTPAHPGQAGFRLEVLPIVAAIGAGVYVAVLLALPLLDTGFNALAAHPEDYARGRYGVAVTTSYLALAVALGCLVLSLLPVRGLAVAVPVLLIPAAALCVALAVDPIAVARGNGLILVPIFGLALGPLVGSLTLRDRFRPWDGALLGLGVLVVIAFAALLAAPDSAGGAVNRAFDVLAGLWVAAAALAAHRRAASRTDSIGLRPRA